MADKKITELSSVSTLPDGAVFTAVDSTRSAGDQNVQISKADLAADIGGGGGELEYQTEITTSTTLTTQEGLNKVYPVNSASDVVITVPQGVYSENDVINFERRGEGAVEFVGDTNVTISGVRDIDNRFFINDRYSWVSLICRGTNLFTIIGRLTDGYSGPVVTSFYGSLPDGTTNYPVTVLGTGFSSNMDDPIIAGNATLVSWNYVSQTQITLNLTETGASGDLLTVTYNNGETTVDVDAIEIVSYNTSELRHYYPLETNSNDSVILNTINGSDTAITYTSGWADFDGSTSRILLANDASFSYGNGINDEDLSLSFQVELDSTSARIACKFGNGSNREYRFEITSGKMRLACQDDDAPAVQTFECDTVLSTATPYHIVVTRNANTENFEFYIDGVVTSKTEIANDVGYVAMEALSDDVSLGALSYSFSNALNGRLRRLGFWNKELSASEVSAIYNEEVTNDNNLL